ncbi:hypothetical protein [Trichlorobacter lovleyi]|mgnify:CR=1 FL=1|uniref:hypothetical protein n=1 Tax=Trichlorobacter lovleyi TaxID=313985 RepID=UPI0024810C43|nr:hypothetical protein [Trichlorobacter lovleyi]
MRKAIVVLVAAGVMAVSGVAVAAEDGAKAAGGGRSSTNWSIWIDYGMSLKKTGDDAFLNASQYVTKANGSSFGLGIQMFRYFGIRGWVGDADSEYKYKSGVPLAMANRTYFHGRKKFGTAFGFDALGFLPLGGSLSLYAGPGVEVCEEADFFVTEPVDGYQVRLDNRKYMPFLTGSGGLSFRPIAQFVGSSAPFNGLTINAGYHTARGLTFGLGASF